MGGARQIEFSPQGTNVNNNNLDIIGIINVINRRKWLIIALLLLSLIASAVIYKYLPPIYKATATLMIERQESGTTSELNVLVAGERLALTYSQIISSRPVLEQVISNLNLELSVGELENMITVTPVQDTQLVRVSVTGPSADQVVTIANSVCEAFITYIDGLSAANYAQALSDVQTSIDLKLGEINNIQMEIDNQNLLKAELETELTGLELQWSENQDTYRTLLQNIQSLKLTITENANKVRVVEPAHVQESNPPYVASLLLYFDKEIVTGNADYTGEISDLVSQIYGPMLERESLLEEVITRLGLVDSPASLQAQISYNAIRDTQFMELYVRDNDSSRAILIADTIAEIFIEQNQARLSEPYNERLSGLETELNTLTADMEQVQADISTNSSNMIPIDLEIERLETEQSSKNLDLRELQNNYDQLVLEASRSSNTVVISESAVHASEQVQNRIVYVGLSVLMALFIGLGLAFLLEQLDDRIRTTEDVASLIDFKPIGAIGHIEKGKSELILGSNSSPYIAEDFGKLSGAIRIAIKEIPLKKILVTSPHPGEGKSFVAANLAIILARTGAEVILIDADFHRSRISDLFGLDNRKGLSNLIQSNIKGNLLKKTLYPKLNVLTCGAKPDNSLELFSSPALGNVLDTFTWTADVVLIDCPPILTLADTTFLAPLVDGVLLVIKSGLTDSKSAMEAMAILKNSNLKYLGVVLNDVSYRPKSYYKYYEPYLKKQTKETKENKKE